MKKKSQYFTAGVMLLGTTWTVTAMASKDPSINFYGSLHASLDYLDSDVSAAEASASNTDKLSSGDVSLSFNSSKIGLKGEIATELDGLTGFYQIEQNLTPDGSSSNTWATRNTYLGLRWSEDKKRKGELLAGRHDSLVKGIALDYSLLKHTVADRGAILGAGSGTGNVLDLRVENMLMGRWQAPLASGLMKLAVQYSPDAVKSSGYVDNNQRLYLGARADWSSAHWTLAAATEHWQQLAIGSASGDSDSWRFLARYRSEQWTLQGLMENLRYQPDDHGVTVLDRQAWALQSAWKSGQLTWLGSVMKAGSYRHSEDTGALMLSLGVERKLSKKIKTYAVYTRTNNEDNASFQGVDGTHGDELATLPGRSPQAVSAGLMLSF
ncbi:MULTISPECIES: porin [unclassified Oceanobacter]|uniref:porin n=1 Tax=unclassified Oceanobacter TaxID=2620260 RepID=UPI002732B4B6|nr:MULTISPECIES: porin [unclassified Oceanobacter]MDP2608147.1 porin [Oceanobacter sp. 1_MG-2023]MDP2611191.1 porin [Oceanobacter sp. 2_MG-2023]